MNQLFLIILVAIVGYNGYNCMAFPSRLEIVCTNPNGENPVVTGPQITEYTEQLLDPTRKIASCDKFLNSFIELNKLIQDKESLKDVCSESLFNKLRAYHLKYISYYSPEATKSDLVIREKAGLEKIPPSLSDYFINFSSKIAIDCSINLIKEFVHQLRNVDIKQHELDDMKKVRLEARKYLAEDITKDTSHFIRNHFSEIELLPSETIQDNRDKIHLALPDNNKDDIFRVNQLCLIRYNKVYQDLFNPMIRLNNLGYGVGLLKHDEQDALESKALKRWITIIETCEALRRIDFIVDNNQKEPTLVDDKEAVSLKAKLGSQATAPLLNNNSIEQITYEHVPVELDPSKEVDIFRSRVSFEYAIESYIKKRTSFLTMLKRAGRK